MDPGPKPTLPPAAAAYVAAFDAWLAAGEDRNDLLVSELLDACGDEIRAQLPAPQGTTGIQSMHPMHLPMAALLRLLR